MNRKPGKYQIKKSNTMESVSQGPNHAHNPLQSIVGNSKDDRTVSMNFRTISNFEACQCDLLPPHFTFINMTFKTVILR